MALTHEKAPKYGHFLRHFAIIDAVEQTRSYFSGNILHKICSKIQTWIFGLEGEHADHKTTTAARSNQNFEITLKSSSLPSCAPKHENSVTRLGDFLKGPDEAFSYKSSPFTDVVIFEALEKQNFSVENAITSFWTTFKKLGYFMLNHLVTLHENKFL